MVELASTIWADGPASLPHQPNKAQIRAWGTWLENLVQAFLSTGGRIYATRAALNADLAKDANSMAWVIEDPVSANNGVYRKVGASGSGSWVRAADLPYSFIVAEDTGAGSPNAIQATSAIPVSSSALILLYVYETNGAGPVTVQFNGVAPVYTIKTNSGNDPAAGGLVAGSVLAGRASGSEFRLISDQASAALIALAESILTQVEDIRDEVLGAVPNVFAPTIEAIKNLNPTQVNSAFLTQRYLEGQFIWSVGDFSARVAADPRGGLCIESHVIPASLGAWLRVYEGNVLATWFDAVDDGTMSAGGYSGTDSAVAIQAALNAVPWGCSVELPFRQTGSYRVSQTIVVTDGKTLVSEANGDGFGGVGQARTRGAVELMADLSVSPVVSFRGGAASSAVNGRGFAVNRVPGAIPAGSIGVELDSVNNGFFDDIVSRRSAKGFKTKNYCLAITIQNCNTMEVSDVHVEIEDSVEVTIFNTRFGRNGGGDIAANGYIRIKGFVDTLTLLRCQGNQTGGAVTAGILVNSYNNPNGIVVISDSHFEMMDEVFLIQENAWSTPLRRLTISNTTMHCNNLNKELIAVANADYSLDQLVISGCPSIGFKLTLNKFRASKVFGNYFIHTVLINAGSAQFFGNDLADGLTVTGTCDEVRIHDNTLFGGTLTNTANGEVYVFGNSGPNAAQSDARINSIPGETLRLGSTGIDAGTRRFTGTLDGTGAAVVTHGMGNDLATRLLGVEAFYKGGSGEASRCNISYVDGANIVISGGGASRPFRVVVTYSKTPHGW